MTKIWLLVFIVLTFVFSTSAQNSPPKTVTDFFLSLPEKYFAPYINGEGATPNLRDYRKSIIKIEDIKNGYLRIEEPTTEGWAEVAIFKKTNGKYIVGISQVGCGPSCSSEETFLSYENGNWQEITAQVLPKITEAQVNAAYKRGKVSKENQSGLLVYELPRTGTTIKVKTGDDDAAEVVLFELNWNGANFVLKSK
ncbi:MAG: hypothetical protein ABJA66_18475 [Actinomycetota bacterium]